MGVACGGVVARKDAWTVARCIILGRQPVLFLGMACVFPVWKSGIQFLYMKDGKKNLISYLNGLDWIQLEWCLRSQRKKKFPRLPTGLKHSRTFSPPLSHLFLLHREDDADGFLNRAASTCCRSSSTVRIYSATRLSSLP
jgi:hypothetical protein